MFPDLKFALRSLSKSPGFSLVAIATLAVAIGVNSAIFSLVNGLFLRSLVPYKPAEVVNIFTARKAANRDYRQFSYPEFAELREANPVFNDVAALTFSLVGVGRGDAMRRSFVFFVSDNFFGLLGVRPAAGRFFTTAESQPDANAPVVVTSHAFWQRMGGRPDFIGSTIQINGQQFTVIGISPKGFTGINAVISPDLWLPLGTYSKFANPLAEGSPDSDLTRPTTYALNLMGRFNPGVSLPSAIPLLPVLARRLDALQPPEAATAGARELQIQAPSRFSISTEPSHDGPVAAVAAFLLGMAGVVLLIACLNLANMSLARGLARSKEIAIRLSLGAPRWRIIRLFLLEGLLLSLCGGALGLLIAQWSNDLLAASLNSAFRAMNFSISIELGPDGRVLVATLLLCVATTLMFCLGPALKSVRGDLVHDLKLQAGEPAAAGRWNRLFSGRHCLVMAQISLSLVLLFTGGLFLRGALNASGLDLGFKPAGCAVAELDFSLAGTPEATARQKMFALLSRLQGLPGVRSAALATRLPYTNVDNTRRLAPAEAAPATGPDAKQSGTEGTFCAMTPGLFDAIGVHLLRGRTFTPAESEDDRAPAVVIVDAKMAELLFPNGDALGRRVRPTDGSSGEMEIVGIVANHRNNPHVGEITPRLYVPLARGYSPDVFLTVRFASENPKSLGAAMSGLRQALRDFDPDLPVLRLVLFSDIVDGNLDLWMIRSGAVMFGLFGGIALVLSVVGVYGVKAYAVARRTREIGIRMALGAMPTNVFALLMRQGLLQTAVAVSLGSVLSLLLGKALSSHFVSVSPHDPLVLGASIALLAGSALLACYLPARRATRVNPTEALRAE